MKNVRRGSKFITIMMMTTLATMLTGCSEIVRTDRVKDTLVVTELEYEPEHTTTSVSVIGKSTVPRVIHHDAVYEVDFDYKGIKLEVDDEHIYKKVKNKLYKEVICDLEINYYSDNTYEIIILDVE